MSKSNYKNGEYVVRIGSFVNQNGTVHGAQLLRYKDGEKYDVFEVVHNAAPTKEIEAFVQENGFEIAGVEIASA